MRPRDVLVGAGVLALAAGVAVVVDPGLAAIVDAQRTLVYAVGAITALFALGAIQRRRRATIEQAETPDPEDRATLRSPGDDVDAALRTGNVGPRTRAAPGGDSLRDRVRTVAVARLVDRENCTPEAAESMLEAGTWTDDPLAAAYFSQEHRAQLQEGYATRLRAFLGRTPSEADYARHAIAELVPEGSRW